ncbi:carboxymuconolactone decarboxylase family protein [Aquabacterium sp. UBA2148]|uniref:carboxymuconolactone decarboxylase family protein n=1 Tax=Aquabacterium sp. UBA2148 TaxID=1946042 RepID=UPI002579D900|nr:carboxymuconolactone decarboxylase family protein [Aquabacterium sp. UBA2148]
MSHQPYIQVLSSVNAALANETQKPLLEQALKQVGFIPNMYANMVNVPAVLSTYLHGYGLFRKESGLAPAEQEVAFLAISMANGCDYCAAAHSMIADKVSNVPAAVLQAIRSRQPIADSRLSALHALATELVNTQGRPSPETVQAFLRAGFQEQHILWLILAVAVKTLSNFSNHAFGTVLDDRFAAHALNR